MILVVHQFNSLVNFPWRLFQVCMSNCWRDFFNVSKSLFCLQKGLTVGSKKNNRGNIRWSVPNGNESKNFVKILFRLYNWKRCASRRKKYRGPCPLRPHSWVLTHCPENKYHIKQLK